MKKLLYLYPFDFQKVFLEKDVGLLPRYLSEIFDLSIDLALFDDYEIKKDINDYYKNDGNIQTFFFDRVLNLNSKKLPKMLTILGQLKIINYVRRNIINYQYVFMFHFSFITWFYLFMIKMLNKDIQVILKLDIDKENTVRISKKSSNLLKEAMHRSLINLCDVISCETKDSYNILINSPKFPEHKVTYLPNGIDENILNLYSVEQIRRQKENIILTVGRLGEYQKNTELILKTLKNIKLNNWKIMFVGPMTKEFTVYKNQFIEENPGLKDNLIFTGPIFDRYKLFEFYAKAKCFILTSRFESYGLVLNEANSFSNYIISTDVGAARDIVGKSKNGIIIDQNEDSLHGALLDFFVNEEKYTDNKKNNNREELGWKNIIKSNKKLIQLIEGSE